MSPKERSRIAVLSQVADGKLSVAKAAELMELSLRQGRRVWKRYRHEGDAALVHGLRGKPGNRSVKASVKRAVLELYRTRYADFGPTLAAEKLAEQGHEVRRETLWRWLVAAGLWARRRRRKAHRSRRERKECSGSSGTVDGWEPPRLVRGAGAVVRADGDGGRCHRPHVRRFVESETTKGAMGVFGAYARKHGLPLAGRLFVAQSWANDQRIARLLDQLRAQGVNWHATMPAKAGMQAGGKG